MVCGFCVKAIKRFWNCSMKGSDDKCSLKVISEQKIKQQ